MTVTRNEQFECCATTFKFAYGFSLCRALLVIGETRPTSKMSVTFVAGDAKVVERARRAVHEVAECLVTDVCYFTPTTFVARPTDVPFYQSTRYVCDHTTNEY